MKRNRYRKPETSYSGNGFNSMAKSGFHYEFMSYSGNFYKSSSGTYSVIHSISGKQCCW